MTRFYSDETREDEKYSLPDCEVFQLTALEAAEYWEDEIREAMRMKRFQLAGFNSTVRERMLEWIVEKHGITGGWFYWFCFPGCMPDSTPFGPFDSREDAIADCRDTASY